LAQEKNAVSGRSASVRLISIVLPASHSGTCRGPATQTSRTVSASA
jgi:hypothetical protein